MIPLIGYVLRIYLYAFFAFLTLAAVFLYYGYPGPDVHAPKPLAKQHQPRKAPY